MYIYRTKKANNRECSSGNCPFYGNWQTHSQTKGEPLAEAADFSQKKSSSGTRKVSQSLYNVYVHVCMREQEGSHLLIMMSIHVAQTLVFCSRVTRAHRC